MAPFRDDFRDGSMLLGYARVSTDDQDLALQHRALREAGCRRLHEEKLSGARRDRPELARLLYQLREDDVLAVTRLDRLARSTRDLLDLAERLRGAGAGLRSLAEPWVGCSSQDRSVGGRRRGGKRFGGQADQTRARRGDEQRGCRLAG